MDAVDRVGHGDSPANVLRERNQDEEDGGDQEEAEKLKIDPKKLRIKYVFLFANNH